MSPLETVKAFIIDHFLFGEDGQLDNDTPFFGSGLVDSMGMLEIVSFVEETYGIKVEDDELMPENFANLETVGRYLTRKLNGKAK